MTFTDLGRNPPGEIIADDLLAVALLDITWRSQVVRVLLGSGGQRCSNPSRSVRVNFQLNVLTMVFVADLEYGQPRRASKNFL
jgi:hypothetical protein